MDKPITQSKLSLKEIQEKCYAEAQKQFDMPSNAVIARRMSKMAEENGHVNFTLSCASDYYFPRFEEVSND